MRLYEATPLLAQLEQRMDDLMERGEEIPPQLYEGYEALQGDRIAKIGNIGRFIKSLRAESKAFDDEIATLKQRQGRVDKKIESLISYLGANFNDDEKYQDPTVAIRWHPSSSCDVINEDALPLEFIEVKHIRSVNKKDLLRELRAGVAVPGAQLKESRSLQIK